MAGYRVDLRSDTVTTPSATMRRAMAEAEVGDDWYGDDPTVNRLQDRAAEVTGKEEAIYVASGTMANQIALHQFVRSGHFVVCESTAHVTSTEMHSSAVLSGIAFHRLVASARGQLTVEQVADALQPDPYKVEVVDLVQVENTHQVGGGTVMAIDDLRGIRKAAQEAGVPVYMDGARLFNAVAASGVPAHEYAAETDAVMFCLSKGLGAPVGSVLCGPDDFIEEARRSKILFGGAWRQAGVIAAAGLVALEEGPKRLHEDHANAHTLAGGIADATPGAIDPAGVETNMLFVDTTAVGQDPWSVYHRLRDRGVWSNVVAGKIRLVTHRDVTQEGIERTIAVWRTLATEWAVEGDA
jgi:threonine aldolase